MTELNFGDTNIWLIGTDIDHKVKYNSATTEPAWNNGTIGIQPGLFIWRIEDFHVVPWPKELYGQFYDGDSYIVLYSYTIPRSENGEQAERLAHDIFFWLGAKTTQDEAGTAAYKTVELDEFLHGVATQHREIQLHPSDEFLTAHGHSVVVHEVDPTWQSLDDGDVFILEKDDKIWVWQGKDASPMEKAKAAQVVNELTLAKHIDVEVLAQTEARSKIVVDLLGGGNTDQSYFRTGRPIHNSRPSPASSLLPARPPRLFRIVPTESGQFQFELDKEGGTIRLSDLDSNDIFIFDTGRKIWVWEGQYVNTHVKDAWKLCTGAYLRYLQQESQAPEVIAATPVAKVKEGNENAAFFQSISAH
ncbi:actin-binding protein Fragmin, putative [Talaromyces stipitatus ATCC 10500]|uniref:Actin-binding protein Fragmin, putative n=1 Tax=Talaromyces stipitatus (strain ATCC 10500 / CBS 375.48 / QM 6759 / NRRL 1006) TaxID=441959 RepID=B8M3U0_TALSN|nr:actin-binding protein Fragmin, putative [Talaromyces stipitatus ATCC 10500]EED20683.1 actin-binding protein Fragmin, putative [Talaromyces stipitatus ATCC 10500]